MKNYLPKQYKLDKSYNIKHNYLSETVPRLQNYSKKI